MASGSDHTIETHRPNPDCGWVMSGPYRIFEFEFIVNIKYPQSSYKQASSHFTGVK